MAVVHGQKLACVKPGGRARDMGEVIALGQRIKRHECRVIRAAKPRKVGDQGLGLHAILAQGAQGAGVKAFGELTPVFVQQQGQVGKAEVVGARAQSFGNVDLHTRIGYVVFPTNNMADPCFEVIHDGSEGVEHRAIGTHQHRVGDGGQLDLTVPHNHVTPAHNAPESLKRQ